MTRFAPAQNAFWLLQQQVRTLQNDVRRDFLFFCHAKYTTSQNRMGRRWGHNACYGAWLYFVRCFRVEKCPPKKRETRRTKRIIGQCETGRGRKKGQQDRSHLAQELTSETCCARKRRREGKTKKKTWATTGWPYGREQILEFETRSTRLYSLELALEGGCGQRNECLK